jgi:MbtH protein
MEIRGLLGKPSIGEDEDDGRLFTVLVNDEDQYSIWPRDRLTPAGWREADVQGTRAECLAHIERVWTDMRPLSLRNRMKQGSGTVGS